MSSAHFRTFSFIVFVCLFFVTAALALFYAFGYRFSFARGIFIYTGSITVKSTPETVSIRVDDMLIPEKELGLLNNSFHLSGLAPGEHFLEVSAPGYRPWSKKVVVQSGLSTEFWNVFLIKERYEPETILSAENIVKLFPAPETELYAVIKQNGDDLSVDTLDIGSGQETEVFSLPGATFDMKSDENLEWSPESHKFLLPSLRRDQTTHMIVDVETSRTADLQDLARTSLPLRSPRWDPTAKDRLYYLEGDTLYRADTEAIDTAPTLLAEHVRSYDLSGNLLYYVNGENGLVYRFPAGADRPQPTQVTSVPMTLSAETSATLVVYDQDRLALYESNKGTLFVFNRQAKEPLRTLATDIKGVQFSDDGKKLLFFSDNEISAVFLRAWEVQPTREADSVVQIARFSAPIRNVQWTEDYEHVLFSSNGTVKLIELDNRDRRDLADIVSTGHSPLQILSSFRENRLYIVRQDASTHRDLITFRFPETPGLFGF